MSRKICQLFSSSTSETFGSRIPSQLACRKNLRNLRYLKRFRRNLSGPGNPCVYASRCTNCVCACKIAVQPGRGRRGGHRYMPPACPSPPGRHYHACQLLNETLFLMIGQARTILAAGSKTTAPIGRTHRSTTAGTGDVGVDALTFRQDHSVWVGQC